MDNFGAVLLTLALTFTVTFVTSTQSGEDGPNAQAAATVVSGGSSNSGGAGDGESAHDSTRIVKRYTPRFVGKREEDESDDTMTSSHDVTVYPDEFNGGDAKTDDFLSLLHEIEELSRLSEEEEGGYLNEDENGDILDDEEGGDGISSLDNYFEDQSDDQLTDTDMYNDDEADADDDVDDDAYLPEEESYEQPDLDKRYQPRFVGKREPYRPRFVGKRYQPRFVGKRTDESDESVDIDEEKRYRPRFVGKRYQPKFIGKRYQPRFIGKRYQPKFIGKRYQPKFIGKRYQPKFVGKRYQPKFIGKRYQPKFIGKRYQPKFIGKRYQPKFIGKRYQPKFIGKRYQPKFIGKRYIPKFVGKRYIPKFIGKRYIPRFVGKRYIPKFVGKRSSEDATTSIDEQQQDLPMALDKRSADPSAASSESLIDQHEASAGDDASPNSRHKRSVLENGEDSELLKRAWGRYTPWQEIPTYKILKVEGPLLNKRFVAPEFVGRRDSISSILSALNALRIARNEPRIASKRFQAPLFIGKRSSSPQTLYWNPDSDDQSRLLDSALQSL